MRHIPYNVRVNWRIARKLRRSRGQLSRALWRTDAGARRRDGVTEAMESRGLSIIDLMDEELRRLEGV